MRTIPDQYHGVHGHLKMVEAEYLYNAPFRLGNGNYGNLGTFHGRSAVHLAGGVKDSGILGRVFTVDSRDRELDDMFEEHGVEDQIVSIIADSAGLADDFLDWSFRLVFIDADHSYEGVKADFEAWKSKVGEGGEIAFHDSNVEGVSKFLEELPADGTWEMIGLVHTLSWWKRV